MKTVRPLVAVALVAGLLLSAAVTSGTGGKAQATTPQVKLAQVAPR